MQKKRENLSNIELISRAWVFEEFFTLYSDVFPAGEENLNDMAIGLATRCSRHKILYSCVSL